MTHPFDDVVFGKADPDNGIKVGDLVTTYHKGYWVVEKIEKRFHDKPSTYQPNWPIGAPLPSLIHYRKVAEADGTPKLKSTRRNSCCATYCKAFSIKEIRRQYATEQLHALNRMNNLEHIHWKINNDDSVFDPSLYQ